MSKTKKHKMLNVIDKPMPVRWEEILSLLPQTGWQITPAAIAVGYSPNYVESCLLVALKNDHRFQSALEDAKLKLCAKHHIRSDKIIRELMRVAFASMTDYASWDDDGVKFTASRLLSEGQAAAVESVKVTRTTRGGPKKDETVVTTQTQFKLHSKLHALEQLGKIAGVFEADNEQRSRDINYQLLSFTMNGNGNGKKKVDSKTISK